MAAPGWTIRNYNVCLRESRRKYDLSLAEARILYREVRDWKAAPAYGADVDRYGDALREDPALVVESMLYGAPDVIGPVYEAGDYPDDFMLDAGAEIELTAETYGDEE